MTKKAESKPKEEKFTLVELVIQSKVPYPQIIMNLSNKGLLEQYKKEKEVYGKEDIEPSVTLTEFNKIVEA